jgi:hypothetical protein
MGRVQRVTYNANLPCSSKYPNQFQRGHKGTC